MLLLMLYGALGMRRLLGIGAIALALTVGSATLVLANFQSGLEAYERDDYVLAMSIWLPLAERGNSEAQNKIGYMYYHGMGVPADKRAAFEWLHASASNGNFEAQRRVAWMYENAEGVDRNLNEAVNWYRRAAGRGNAKAQLRMGKYYLSGKVVTRNDDKAIQWIKSAAQLGEQEAQHLLGSIHSSMSNNKEAVRWQRKSAEQGYKHAQYALGGHLEMGWGVSIDYGAAAKWYLKAAEQGHAYAQLDLGNLFRDGKGVQKDIGMAKYWYEKAAQQGSEDAVTALAALTEIEDQQIIDFRTSTSFPNDIAIIIANSNYKKLSKNIPDVDPAYADAENFKKWVAEGKGVREGNIIYLEDATSAQMISAFGSDRSHKGQLFNWTKPGISNVYIYYAGHGAPAGKEGSANLVPSDTNAATIELTGYPLATLYKNLKKLPAKSITVVLEACFSGASQNGNVVNRTSGLYVTPKIPNTPSNITVISAGRVYQVASWEEDSSQSLFTKYFLKGMSGEADEKPYGNGDGNVSYPELGKYLDGTMAYFARRYYDRDQNAQIVVGVK